MQSIALTCRQNSHASKLEPVWNAIAPGFHQCLYKNRATIFIKCLTLEAREKHLIFIRFTTNALENKHCLQKKVLKEDNIFKEIVSLSESLSL